MIDSQKRVLLKGSGDWVAGKSESDCQLLFGDIASAALTRMITIMLRPSQGRKRGGKKGEVPQQGGKGPRWSEDAIPPM